MSHIVSQMMVIIAIVIMDSSVILMSTQTRERIVYLIIIWVIVQQLMEISVIPLYRDGILLKMDLVYKNTKPKIKVIIFTQIME